MCEITLPVFYKGQLLNFPCAIIASHFSFYYKVKHGRIDILFQRQLDGRWKPEFMCAEPSQDTIPDTDLLNAIEYVVQSLSDH